jgi:hypothetical protein
MAWDSERASRLRDCVGSESFCDIAFRQLREEPMKVVRKIYERFDYELTGKTAANMQEWLQHRQKRKQPPHVYNLAEFGLHPDVIEGRLSPYCGRFADLIGE